MHVHVFAYFSNELFYVFLLTYRSSFYSLDTKILLVMAYLFTSCSFWALRIFILLNNMCILTTFFLNFFYFWLHWVFIAAHGLSLVAASRATLCGGARASHCSGFSCCRARALGTQTSVVVARRL